MCASMSVSITVNTMRDLLDYSAEHGCERDRAELVDMAIREWLEHQRDRAKPQIPKGYLWKTVLLPNDARLRIASHYCLHYATIVGGELIYNELSMSPNQFASASLGMVRNAWEAIYVQFPGETDWKPAVRLRYAAAAQARRTACQRR